MKRLLKRIGPGPLLAAAFIGPGTITMCTRAGVNFGVSLLWALGLSIITTISLQEMSARLGLVTRKDLAAIISELKSNPFTKWGIILLVLSAIVIGNTAYEAGNLAGGALGIGVFISNSSIYIAGYPIDLAPLILGLLAFMVLSLESLKRVQNILIGLVILMSLAFTGTALLTRPNWASIIEGLFVFNMPDASVLFVVGLIGTTVVPYNLFLHSALVIKKWDSVKGLKESQLDTFIAVILGGLVSMCVLIAASSIRVDSISSGADLAIALKPLFGNSATYFIGAGLFAAGLTSAITAPMAAAFVVCGIFGKAGETESNLYRAVWKVILVFGMIAAMFNVNAIQLITFAQVANGFALPVIALILIWIMNRKSILGNFTNNLIQNSVGFLVLLVTIALCYRMIIILF